MILLWIKVSLVFDCYGVSLRVMMNGWVYKFCFCEFNVGFYFLFYGYWWWIYLGEFFLFGLLWIV